MSLAGRSYTGSDWLWVALRPSLPARDWFRPPPHRRPLQGQQTLFETKATGVSRQRSIMAHDTVTRNHNGDRIAMAGLAHGSCRPRLSKSSRDLTVGPRLAVRDSQELAPDRQLERRSLEGQRQVEVTAPAPEVLAELTDSSPVRTGTDNPAIRNTVSKGDRNDAFLPRGHRQQAQAAAYQAPVHVRKVSSNPPIAQARHPRRSVGRRQGRARSSD